MSLLPTRRSALTPIPLLGVLGACATPEPPLPTGTGFLEVDLSGEWVSPSPVRVLPAPDPMGDASWSRTIVMPDGWDEQSHAMLRANALGWRARVYVGDREVGTDAGGLRPLEVPLTGALHAGTNQLTIQVEAPRADNVILGKYIPTIGAFTYRQPRLGQIEVAGEIWLELAGKRQIEDLYVRTAGDTITATASVSGADGELVTFTVVRDGEELLRFPPARVARGSATTQATWSGPRWQLGGRDEPFLQYVVATLSDGTARHRRFGVREVTRAGQGLAVDGAPLYLAVQRAVPTAVDARAEVAAIAAVYAKAGLNALELHAAAHSRAFLEAADELGFPVVQTPRCDGRRRDDGILPATPDWAGFIREGNERIVQADRGHPSVLLWNLEASAEPEFPMTYAAYVETGVPAIDLRESNGYNDEHYEEMRRGGPLPAFINELAFRAGPWQGRSLLERLTPILQEHRPFGIGCVLPHVIQPGPPPPEVAAIAADYSAGLAQTLAGLDVPPLPLGRRRGPAAVDVTVSSGSATAAGEIVLLEAPGHAPVAAATDNRGRARLELDYAGAATVRLWRGGAPASVTLTPGAYEGGRWAPSVTTASLVAP